jgi:predicted transcriptional regulator of viral defense system
MHDNGIDRAPPRRARLFEIASEQGGYFTAAQARESGYSRALVAHHAKAGRFIRVRQGLYRLREYPSSSHEDVIAAWLAAGKDAAVISHESALEMLGLSDVIPNVVHITLPRSKRYHTAPAGAAVHTTTRRVGKSDIILREGVRVTGPVRSIVDAAETGTAPEQVVAAIRQALDRGMATKPQLLTAARARGRRVENLVREALDERRHR